MLTLDLTDEQIIALLEQLPDERRTAVYQRFILLQTAKPVSLTAPRPKKQPVFGYAKEAISFIAPDFDEPLDEMKDYMY